MFTRGYAFCYPTTTTSVMDSEEMTPPAPPLSLYPDLPAPPVERLVKVFNAPPKDGPVSNRSM